MWWPGRFDPVDESVTVLARYTTPGPDFWVADLNLATLPKGTMTDWENLYGVHLSPHFMEGLPCVTSNGFGAGKVVLSYAHLETPASPHANHWLGYILNKTLSTHMDNGPIPAWDVTARPVVWNDPTLQDARSAMETIIATGIDHFLLFWRNPWLLGWRRGIPGAGINSLYSLICESQACQPDEATLAFWEKQSPKFKALMEMLTNGLTGYLLAERLAMTVFHSSPDAVSTEGLREQRRALFGIPPEPGGIHSDLVGLLEELYWHLSSS